MKKTLLASLLCLTLLSLCSFGFAADKATRPVAGATATPQAPHAYVDPDAGQALKVLFSNLGTSPTTLYDGANGWLVAGQLNTYNGQMQDIGIPFVAKANATIIGVKYAMQYYGYGVSGFKAAIYSDAAGLPGTALASGDVKVTSNFGDGCCALTAWKLKTPLAVTKGTQYWVVGTTDTKTKDTVQVWDWVYGDTPTTFAFQQDNGGWILLDASNGYAGSAVAVYAQ